MSTYTVFKCPSCGATTTDWKHGIDCPCEDVDEWMEITVTEYAPDAHDPIPWFTDQHAREAAERMKAYAATAPALHVSLSDKTWLNLARVALELRPR